MAWAQDQFRLSGGLDEEDPQFTQPAGQLSFCRNYECLAGGGYRRIEGYERFSGLLGDNAGAGILPGTKGDDVTRPSLAQYYWLPFTAGHGPAITAGDTITGQSSGATAAVVGALEITSGLWAANDVVGKMGLTDIQGVWQNGEIAYASSGGGTVTITSTIQTRSADDASHDSWLAGARNRYRNLIAAPVGTGPILGGFVLNGDCYAWRRYETTIGEVVTDNGSRLHKATGAGWSPVTLTSYLRFAGGTTAVAEGATITGATSAATAIVRRVSIGAGNYAGPTLASGRFAIDTIVGNFSDTEILLVSASPVATARGTQGVSVPILGSHLYPKMECITFNFYGASYDRRAYGCDGYNRAWEFDGTYFIFIETGMTVDAPTFLEAHRNHLFLSFQGGSLQNSATGLPLVWSPRLGAAELGIGDDITGIRSNGNNMLAITSLRSVSILQGTSDLDWSLRSIQDEIGSVAYTLQEAGGQTLFLDRAGVNVIIPAPFTYQDIQTQAISRNVRKTVQRMAPYAVESQHVINKNQYRVFFNDMSALTATFFGTKLMGWMLSQYKHQITAAWGGTDARGVERMYVGVSSVDGGYVMEMDSGASFDGLAIDSVLQLPYNYRKSPDRSKRFHKITLEIETPREVALRLLMEYDYGSGPASTLDMETPATGGRWDISQWEQFFWDSPILTRAELNIDGVGVNSSATIYHASDVDDPFTVSAAMMQFTPYGVRL